jgi:hypothetical protein
MKGIVIRLFELTQVLKYFATLMAATNLAVG